MPAITGLDELIEGLCAMAELQTGPLASRTRARYALVLELAGDPELGEPLRRQRREFERWTERIVIASVSPTACRRRGPSWHSATDCSCTGSPSTPSLTCAPPLNAHCAPSRSPDLTLRRRQPNTITTDLPSCTTALGCLAPIFKPRCGASLPRLSGMSKRPDRAMCVARGQRASRTRAFIRMDSPFTLPGMGTSLAKPWRSPASGGEPTSRRGQHDEQ